MAKPKASAVMKQKKLTPWLYLMPALIVMTFFIVYPMLNTVSLSFQNRDGTGSAATNCREGQPCWGIFENYRYALTNELDTSSFSSFAETFWTSSYGNTLKWIIVMVSGTVILGLLIAVLVDRIKYEPVAKSVIFMPMAISFVGAGVIWNFMYNYNVGSTQIGLLNAIITSLGAEPVAFLSNTSINNFMLIFVGIWMWTGFCMTILSSALKGVPNELLEAARIDGANEFQVFFRVMLPIIMPTVVVVATTMVINVLKLFDIVYVMTGGNNDTEVIATRMYTEMYANFNTGRGTAIAVILIIAIFPFIILNVRRFIAQEAQR